MKIIFSRLVVVTMFIFMALNQYINIDFFIKFVIIMLALLSNILVYRVILSWKINKNGVSIDLLKCLSGNLVSLLIGIIFIKSNNYYGYYCGLINLTIGIVNQIPMAPFRGNDFLKIILQKIYSEDRIDKKNKTISIINKMVLCVIFIIAFIQMILFSYNFSVFVMFIVLLKYNIIIDILGIKEKNNNTDYIY